MLRLSIAAVALVAAASPALADAITYRGTLGPVEIVLELSSEFSAADTGTVGRYFYKSNGIDIPLHVTKAEGGELVLVEENACTDEICEKAFESGDLPSELRGPRWTLNSDDGGERLTGTWGDVEGDVPLDIELVIFGVRPLDLTPPASPLYMAGLPFEIVEGKRLLTSESVPYEYLKVSAFDPDLVETVVEDGMTFSYVADPRSQFRFPRLVDLGGVDLSAANERLFIRHSAMTIGALDCEAQAYLGLGWSPGASNSLGSYAGYPDEQVDVLYLSPTVMSWQESGSLYCGGAYPENHTYLTTIDIATGKDLDLSKVFADSSMGEYRWEPGQSLIDLAISRREKSTDTEFEESCGMDDLIASNLAVTFKRGDIAVFTLQGLPHVIQACQEDIFEAPLAELKDYLAPTAADYFPSLKG